jgi:hypothetical protein
MIAGAHGPFLNVKYKCCGRVVLRTRVCELCTRASSCHIACHTNVKRAATPYARCRKQMSATIGTPLVNRALTNANVLDACEAAPPSAVFSHPILPRRLAAPDKSPEVDTHMSEGSPAPMHTGYRHSRQRSTSESLRRGIVCKVGDGSFSSRGLGHSRNSFAV